MIKIDMEIDETTLRSLVLAHIKENIGEVPIKADDVTIEVKSKQNYKSEWEQAAFRATVRKRVL